MSSKRANISAQASSAAPDFLRGGGEMGERMRVHDWTKTALGPCELWPQSLRTAVRILLNTGHPMYIFWGAEGTCLYNDAYRLSIGPERHPGSLGRPAFEVWEEIWPIIGPQIEQVMSGQGATWNVNHLVPITRNGVREDVYWTYSYTPIDDENAPNSVGGVLVVCTETTEQVLANRALTSVQDRFSRLFEQAPTFMAMLSGPEHRFELANPRYLELVGNRPLIGRTVAEALPDAVAQGYLELLDGVFASGKAFNAYGSKFVPQIEPGKVEGTRYLDFVYQPIIDASGAVTGIFVQGVDATERHTAEEALSAAKDDLEHRVAERTADLQNVKTFYMHSAECHAMLSQRADGSFQYDEINPATLQLYGGMKREDVIGRTIDEIFGSAGAEVNTHLAEALRRGEAYAYSRQQGGRTVEAIATPIPAETGRPHRLAVTARDITEKQNLEEQLLQAQKMEAIGQLTGGIAHDFNNLLQGISGSIEAVIRRVESGRSDGVMRFLEGASASANRAAALTQRLLAFSRRQSLSPKPVYIQRLVAGMADLIRGAVGANLAIETHLPDATWATLVDPNQLENAVLNLCINARDAMPDGGRITIETANVEIGPQSDSDLPPGDYVSISVADTGTGMAPDVATRAFDPFFTTKPIGQGTGLGLSMIFGFAQQSGGRVDITSKVGEGTSVRLYLPRFTGEISPSIDSLDAAAPRQTAHGGIILIVDDEPVIRMLISEMVEDLGYRSIVAGTGAEALKQLERGIVIDLLISDVGLPGGLNGRQVADAARTRRPDLKVLFITGYAEKSVLDGGALSAGMQILPKPFTNEALKKVIADIMGTVPAV